MFQYLADNLFQKKKLNKTDTNTQNRLLIVQNLIIYIVSFLVSMMSIKGTVTPFAMAIFVACCNSNAPAGVILVVTIVGNFIAFGVNSTLTYILTVLIFVFSIIVIKPLIQDGRNEMTKLGKNLIISTAVVQALRCIIKSDLFIYDILLSISNVVLTYVFYKIFVNSLAVIKNFNKKKAFSIEEVIGATILIAIATVTLNDIPCFGLSIAIIISILMTLMLSLRSGILVGGTTGTSIGLMLGILGVCSPMQILAFAIAGLIAGILSRFGKIATIIGFVVGCVLISYISTGLMIELIEEREILIASIIFLFIPRFVGIDITEMTEDVKLLETKNDKRLSETQDAKQKLNSISSVISEMARILEIDDKSLLEKQIDDINNSRVIFTEDLLNYLERFPNNILYEDITDLKNGIIEDIYLKLVEKSEMTEGDLIDIFAKRNNYIIGTENNEVIKEDIDQVIRVINRTYRINEMGFNWKTKFEEQKKTISKQLKGVSKAILNAADDITAESKEKSVFEDKEMQIKELLSQKGIITKEIKIKELKSKKIFVDIYYKNTAIVREKEKIKCIENILSKVCDDKILLQKDTSNIDANDYVQRYASEDRYIMQLGYAQAAKAGNNISGDSSVQIKLEDDKRLILLSDGMGSGQEARKSSQIVIKMMKKLLGAGFDKETSLELINSSIKLNTEEVYATIDAAIFDLYNGNVEFIKNGACKTYIKNKQDIDVVNSNALPLGILNNVEVSVFDRDLIDGEIYIFCSDGITDSKIEEDDDKWFVKMLKNITTNNVQKMADVILNESIDNNYGICKDDMTVVVIKVSKKVKR